MPVPDRTKGAALEVLQDARQQVADDMEDHSDLLTPELLAEVFEQAWRSQFEEERRYARREVRDIVTDCLTSADLGDEE